MLKDKVVANGQRDGWVSLYAPELPDTNYEYLPKFETVEFLCYLGSVISMWVGWSILSLYSGLRHVIIEHVGRRVTTFKNRRNPVIPRPSSLRTRSLIT